MTARELYRDMFSAYRHEYSYDRRESINSIWERYCQIETTMDDIKNSLLHVIRHSPVYRMKWVNMIELSAQQAAIENLFARINNGDLEGDEE